MAQLSIVKKSELEGAMRLDAEYYQPKYLRTMKALQALKAVPLSDVAKPVKRRFTPTDGLFNYIEIAEVDVGTGATNAVEIAGAGAPSRAQWVVKEGDVIVSTVRPARNAVALIGSGDDGFVCSSGFAVLRPIKTSSEFLFAYLKTNIAASLLDRKTTATMYPAVSWEDVLSLPVVLPDSEMQGFVSDRVKESMQKLKDSESLYLQAEQLLLDELGFKDLDLSHQLYYTVPFKKTKEVGRLDAEHFQPKYERLIQHIQRFPYLRLRDVTQTIRNGQTPAAQDYSMVGIPILKVHGLRSGGVIEECGAYVPASWAQENTKGTVRQYDALVLCAAHHPSYIGKTGLLMDDLGPLARAVGELIILRFNNKIRPEFVCVFLNLEHVRLAVQRLIRGNTAHLYPDDLSTLPVPLLPSEFQQRIADLVTQSWEAWQKARQLLEEAKHKIENIVEGKSN